jgi:hypothetical protein
MESKSSVTQINLTSYALAFWFGYADGEIPKDLIDHMIMGKACEA